MRNHLQSVKAGLFSLFFSCSLQATDIQWRSTLFQTNQDSSGQSLDTGWTFSLGYFENFFSPDPFNTASWCDNWVTLDIAAYDTIFSRFAGVWSDTGQVPFGKQGYLWGYNRGAETPEWILITNSTWKWPLFVNPIDPSADVEWTVANATEAIVGEIQTGMAHMKTQSVAGEPPLLKGEMWLTLHFSAVELANATISGWNSDPDGDGLTNLEEFAFGEDPQTASPLCVEHGFETGHFQFTVPKGQKVAVDYFGQIASQIPTWKEGNAFVSLVGETTGSLTYRDLTPSVSSTRRFGRVRVALQP